MIEEFYKLSPRLLELDKQARGLCAGQFAALEEIKEYLAGNLCRCSGYEGQLRGILNFLEWKKEAKQ